MFELNSIKKNVMLTGVLLVFSFVCFSVVFAQSNIKISGVLLGRVNSAIINEDIKKEGEYVGDMQIVEITEKYVKFKSKDKEFSVRLGKQVKKGLKGFNLDSQNLLSYNKSIKFKVRRRKYQDNESRVNSFFNNIFSNMSEQEVLNSILKSGPIVMITVSIVLLLLIYAFPAFTLQRIASKTSTPNGWFAWIPIMNLILHCDIAKKPRWWTLIMILILAVPIAGLIAAFVMYIILWMRIAEARSKPGWLGLLMLVPVLGITFLHAYLAFSGNKQQELPSSEGIQSSV